MTLLPCKACVFSLTCYLVIVNLLALLSSQTWFYDSKFIPGCPDNNIVAVTVDTMAKQMTIGARALSSGLSAFPCCTQVSLMTLMAHSNHQCHPFVCFVAVDVMLSNISFAHAFTNSRPIFSFTIESEICVSGQTMRRQLWGKMISTDIMRCQMPWCSLYLCLFNLVAKPHWSIMQSCSLLWKQGFDSFSPHKNGCWYESAWYKININGATSS